MNVEQIKEKYDILVRTEAIIHSLKDENEQLKKLEKNIEEKIMLRLKFNKLYDLIAIENEKRAKAIDDKEIKTEEDEKLLEDIKEKVNYYKKLVDDERDEITLLKDIPKFSKHIIDIFDDLLDLNKTMKDILKELSSKRHSVESINELTKNYYDANDKCITAVKNAYRYLENILSVEDTFKHKLERDEKLLRKISLEEKDILLEFNKLEQENI